jgi:hypothetical protein
MPDEIPRPPETGDSLKHCSLQRISQAEGKEMMKHKEVEAEAAGRDLEFERALTDWVMKRRAEWTKQRQGKPRA